MISHSSDPLAAVRRTELPVLLMAGMNLLGFAQQHIVRQFKSSSLAALGILTVCICGNELSPTKKLTLFAFSSHLKILWYQTYHTYSPTFERRRRRL